jgi:hypothetical protein
MLNYRVSLSFTGLSDADLDEFAGNIVVSLTGNTAFPTPLVPLAALGAAQSAFHDAVLAAAQGGTQLTAIKNENRTALEDLLRQEASYVQAIASHNLSTLCHLALRPTARTARNRRWTRRPSSAWIMGRRRS